MLNVRERAGCRKAIVTLGLRPLLVNGTWDGRRVLLAGGESGTASGSMRKQMTRMAAEGYWIGGWCWPNERRAAARNAWSEVRLLGVPSKHNSAVAVRVSTDARLRARTSIVVDRPLRIWRNQVAGQIATADALAVEAARFPTAAHFVHWLRAISRIATETDPSGDA
jgi:hypothetical protein